MRSANAQPLQGRMLGSALPLTPGLRLCYLNDLLLLLLDGSIDDESGALSFLLSDLSTKYELKLVLGSRCLERAAAMGSDLSMTAREGSVTGLSIQFQL